MKKNRIGTEYVFFAFPPFKYLDETIFSLGINVVFEIYDRSGNEMLFDGKSETPIFTKDKNYYAQNLLIVKTDEKQLFVLEPVVDLVKEFSAVSYKVISYTKSVVKEKIAETEYIDRDEFENIFTTNFSNFDNRTNKSASASSYFFQSV